MTHNVFLDKTYTLKIVSDGLFDIYPQTDILSVGVLLFIMVTGERPFERADKKDFLYKSISNGRSAQFFWRFIENKLDIKLSSEIKSLITALFQDEPNQRPSIAEVFGMPWMTK